ncbi:hypothetical protein FRIGORI9N_60050 [Frigoribacterium sp. 9N]|nr:hypothetical protein FRIGORI9N_60050 [Frigoribacterium sp. 9N]
MEQVQKMHGGEKVRTGSGRESRNQWTQRATCRAAPPRSTLPGPPVRTPPTRRSATSTSPATSARSAT